MHQLDKILGKSEERRGESASKPKILIVDDDQLMLGALEGAFRDAYKVVCAASGQEAIDKARSDADIYCVVMDIKMPEMDGITAAREIRAIAPELPVIFHTGYPGDYQESQIEKQERPFGYVVKGQGIEPLARSVRNAVESSRLRRENKLFVNYLESQFGIIGRSNAMREVCRLIRQSAASGTRVMILGETGTGKELVARAIHNHSERNSQRFARLNCNHKDPGQVESELFGHRKGAFSNVTDRVGKFEYANGGSLFLDEIGDLDMTAQAKILQVIENGEMEKIGDPSPRQVDVRVLSATHRDLGEMVAHGAFREDLYYRLKGIVIQIPPLRDRREDIPILTEKFTDRFTVERGKPIKIFDRSAIDAMISYDWPGNVRQLLNTVETLVDLTDSDLITADDLVNCIAPDSESRRTGLQARLREYERTLIVKALSEANYNITDAASLLEIDRATLHKKIKSLEINVPALKSER